MRGYVLEVGELVDEGGLQPDHRLALAVDGHLVARNPADAALKVEQPHVGLVRRSTTSPVHLEREQVAALFLRPVLSVIACERDILDTVEGHNLDAFLSL